MCHCLDVLITNSTCLCGIGTTWTEFNNFQGKQACRDSLHVCGIDLIILYCSNHTDSNDKTGEQIDEEGMNP